jgi:MFS family permease
MLPGRRRPTATLALLAFAMLIVSLDQYIVVVALPEIGRELGYSTQTLQSVISAYAVASAGFLLLGGRAADLLGPLAPCRGWAERSSSPRPWR